MNTNHYHEIYQNFPLEGEKFMNIPGYCIYAVSNFGRVFTSKYNKIRKQAEKRGYLVVDLWKGGKGKNFPVHRLVGLLFVPNPDNKPDLNHKDGDRKNNHYSNLEWVTKSENTLHAFRVLGRTVLKGEKHGMYGKKNPKAHFSKKV